MTSLVLVGHGRSNTTQMKSGVSSAKQNRGSDQGGLLKLGFLIEVSMGERRKKGGKKVVFRMKMCSG